MITSTDFINKMKDGLKIIGLSGTNGSGKDTVGNIIAELYSYLFISVTDLLRDEAKKRGVPAERGELRQISAEWRRESGLGVLVDKAVEQYKSTGNEYKGVVMASLRNPGEVDRIHELGGINIWLDADSKVRYQRIRSANRGREEDDKTYEQFLSEESAEMQASGDEATLNMSGVKAKSDIMIENDKNNIESLKEIIKNSLNY
jgi:cytidylate kinase